MTKLYRLVEWGGVLAPHMSRSLMSSHMPRLWRCGANLAQPQIYRNLIVDNPEGLYLTPEAVGRYTHSGSDNDDDVDDDAIFRRQCA